MIPVSVLGHVHRISVFEIRTGKQEDSRDGRHRALLSECPRDVVLTQVMAQGSGNRVFPGAGFSGEEMEPARAGSALEGLGLRDARQQGHVVQQGICLSQ